MLSGIEDDDDNDKKKYECKCRDEISTVAT